MKVSGANQYGWRDESPSIRTDIRKCSLFGPQLDKTRSLNRRLKQWGALAFPGRIHEVRLSVMSPTRVSPMPTHVKLDHDGNQGLVVLMP